MLLREKILRIPAPGIQSIISHILIFRAHMCNGIFILIAILTNASSVSRYIDCVSKSSGPKRKTVPSVVSGDETFWRIANCGGLKSSRITELTYNGFFLAIT